MEGRDSYRLDPAASIQEQKYCVYRTLPVWKSGTVFADCLKYRFLISLPEEVICLTFFLCAGYFLAQDIQET